MIMNDPIARALGPWASELGTASILFRVLISAVISAIIGWERSSKRHSAGLRTFMLVSLGSTVVMMLDLILGEASGKPQFLLSAATIVAIAVISINSILFSSRNQIKGLTTSVGLWTFSIVGLTLGAGLYTLTLISFIALLTELMWFPAVEKYLMNRSNHFEVHLELKSSMYLPNFVSTIRRLGLTIDDIELNPAYANSGLSVYSIAISVSSQELKKYKTHSEIIEALRVLDYVYYIEAMHQ